MGAAAASSANPPSESGLARSICPISRTIKLPGEAVLEIQGAKTKQTGEVRRFQSPPLTIGARYTYTFKAVWKEGDKEITRERSVVVQPGTEVVVDLREELPKK